MLLKHFGEDAEAILAASPLLQYLNIKTRSANRGSKARGSFANHYALYVLVEDYLAKGFAEDRKGQYKRYEGARFSDLFRRQRELPFGAKLQNHALNSRLNDEFAKYFPTLELRPILRDQKDQRYWVNVFSSQSCRAAKRLRNTTWPSQLSRSSTRTSLRSDPHSTPSLRRVNV